MARRATSLGPKSSVFLVFLFFFVVRKWWCLPPETFSFFSVSLCLSLVFPFSLSFSLSLYISCSFVLVFVWLIICFSLFAFYVLFHEKNNIKISKYFFHQLFCFVFLSCFVFQNSNPFLSLFLPSLKLCFGSTSVFYISNKTAYKTPMFGEFGVATKRFL